MSDVQDRLWGMHPLTPSGSAIALVPAVDGCRGSNVTAWRPRICRIDDV